MSTATTMAALGIEPIFMAWYPGDTAPIAATVTDTSTGLGVDITGCRATLTLKPLLTSADSAALWRLTTTGGGITLTAASTGQLLIQPTLAQSTALTPGRTYPFDLIITTPGGSLVTTVTGYLKTLQRITTTPSTS